MACMSLDNADDASPVVLKIARPIYTHLYYSVPLRPLVIMCV